MKASYLMILFLSLAAIQCKDESAREKKLRELTEAPQEVPSTAPPKATVQHYICMKNCKGSGSDKEGTCPVCGQPYTHNADFHAQADPASTPATQPVVTPVQTAPGQYTVPAGGSEPAQNVKGVWHFTCPKGCAGGAGAKGKCPKCSTELAHNQEYHTPQ